MAPPLPFSLREAAMSSRPCRGLCLLITDHLAKKTQRATRLHVLKVGDPWGNTHAWGMSR